LCMPDVGNRLTKDMKRAALYARVSTEEQAMHGVSLEAQRERLLRYAEENGLTVVDVYVDEGVSARKRYTARAAFMRMLDDVRQGKIDVVLFVKLDRWFRNIADYYEVQAILDRYGVAWIATEEDYDTTTANGRLALNIKLTIAQDESDRTSERIKFVFQNMVKEGRVISGKTPLGYRIENKRAVVDEAEAELVRDIFEHYIDCRSMKATERYVLERYGRHVDNQSIRRMIGNTWYIGEAYGIKDWCPAIIDEATFHLANSIREVAATRNSGVRSDRVYLFTGLIFCGCCGKRMTTYTCRNKNPDGTTRQEFVYYRCAAHNATVCRMAKQFNQSKVEKWLLDNIASEAERFNSSVKQQRKVKPKRTVDTARVMGKLERLKDLYLNDLIDREMYERDYRELTAQLKEANRVDREAKTIDLSALSNLKEAYAELSEEGKKAFWSRTVHRITAMEDGELKVTFREG